MDDSILRFYSLWYGTWTLAVVVVWLWSSRFKTQWRRLAVRTGVVAAGFTTVPLFSPDGGAWFPLGAYYLTSVRRPLLMVEAWSTATRGIVAVWLALFGLAALWRAIRTEAGFVSKAWPVAGVGLMCGAAVWSLSVPGTETRLPFASTGFSYQMVMLVAGAIAALPAPRYWWVAVFAIFTGERLYALLMLPETRASWPLSLILSALLPTWLPAAIGAALVFVLTRLRKRRSSGD